MFPNNNLLGISQNYTSKSQILNTGYRPLNLDFILARAKVVVDRRPEDVVHDRIL